MKDIIRPLLGMSSNRPKYSGSHYGKRRMSTTSSVSDQSSTATSANTSETFDGSSASSFRRSSVSTDLSSAPSAYTDDQPGPDLGQEENNGHIILCELVHLGSCPGQFRDIDFEQWCDHILLHLDKKFPKKSGCPFCNRPAFDAALYGGNRETAFCERLSHIWGHRNDSTMPDMRLRPDYILASWLREHDIITEEAFASSCEPCQYIQDHNGKRLRVPHLSTLWSVDEIVASSE
ncbi:hypothetical protein MN608_01398 [Microdochium nivale]|nr:hypothetical protein MN608_01398 [Microdochium nivale]